MKDEIPFEIFAPLTELPFIQHAFTIRSTHDTRSDDFPVRLVRQLGYDRFAAAEQPHGDGVAVVDSSFIPHPSSFPSADALTTRETGLPLVIRCADCAAVFIVDRRTPAIALVHSGKKGTAADVVGNTIAAMQRRLGTAPADCLAFISPSIGPCHYEMDIWSGIELQLQEAGIRKIHNPRVCTACHLNRYFSYRAEKGNTGRMLAVLALRERSRTSSPGSPGEN